MMGKRAAFDLAISGKPLPHLRPAMIVPLALRLPAGRADNRYAPLALNIGDAARISESFDAVDGETTYYLVLSSRLDRTLSDPSGEEDARVVAVHYEINRGKPGVMAKRYAEGDCIIMDGQS